MLRLAQSLRVRFPPPRGRAFGWSAVNYAQPRLKLATTEDITTTLQKSPVIQAVVRRMQLRSELQSQVSSMFSV
jgi:hypothetical protein